MILRHRRVNHALGQPALIVREGLDRTVRVGYSFGRKMVLSPSRNRLLIDPGCSGRPLLVRPGQQGGCGRPRIEPSLANAPDQVHGIAKAHQNGEGQD